MGRKPKPKEEKVDWYFDEEVENGVVSYIETDCAYEKNRIFETKLRVAFTKMIEIIIRRYKLFPQGEDFRETCEDALSHIVTKMVGYKKGSGAAYSYIQTICRRHLINKIKDTNKTIVRDLSYDDFESELVENIEFSYNIHNDDELDFNDLMKKTIISIQQIMLNTNDKKLTKNEILVGHALVTVLENWDELFSDLSNNKFNKSTILLYIQEVTNLSTSDVKIAMKRFKNSYLKTKKSVFI